MPVNRETNLLTLVKMDFITLVEQCVSWITTSLHHNQPNRIRTNIRRLDPSHGGDQDPQSLPLHNENLLVNI